MFTWKSSIEASTSCLCYRIQGLISIHKKVFGVNLCFFTSTFICSNFFCLNTQVASSAPVLGTFYLKPFPCFHIFMRVSTMLQDLVRIYNFNPSWSWQEIRRKIRLINTSLLNWLNKTRVGKEDGRGGHQEFQQLSIFPLHFH